MYFVYFGDCADRYAAAVKRAYLDFNRTLHKFGENEQRHEAYSTASRFLEEELRAMLSLKMESQEQFDQWHRKCCDRVIEIFATDSHHKLYYGQAQKWINMALKYLFVLERDVTVSNYRYFHIPIDNVVLEKLKPHPRQFFGTSWSRIDRYDEYLDFQAWYREFDGIPMDNEFTLWMK